MLNSQIRIAQAFKYIGKNKKGQQQTGLTVVSVYVSWQDDPIRFCHTRVVGSQQLRVNRKVADDSKNDHYISFQDAQIQFQKLADSQGYCICEPMKTWEEIEEIVENALGQRERALPFIKPLTRNPAYG